MQGSQDIKMEQLKYDELLIMSVEGYLHIYDKLRHHYKIILSLYNKEYLERQETNK